MSSLVTTARFVTAWVERRGDAGDGDARGWRRRRPARWRPPAGALPAGRPLGPRRVDLLVNIHEGADAADRLPQVRGNPRSRSVRAWVSSRPLTIARLLRARWLISSLRCSARSARPRSAARSCSRCSTKRRDVPRHEDHGGGRERRGGSGETQSLPPDVEGVLHLHLASGAERLCDVFDEEVGPAGPEKSHAQSPPADTSAGRYRAGRAWSARSSDSGPPRP